MAATEGPTADGPVAAGPTESDYQQVDAALRQRWPDEKVVPSLDREARLMDLLGDPQRTCPVIQVGGTNGKSSTARMIDALLREAGLRVGRFTSPEPRLSDRIALHGEPIDPDGFVSLYREIEPYVAVVDKDAAQPLTGFEVVTAMAFMAFADAAVDVAVVEVGMGGAWDCTNVADAAVAVLCPISLDHQKYLGDTITDIAWEKVGIIKPGATVVTAAQVDEAAEVILQHCAEVEATVAREGAEFGVLRRALAVGGQVLTLQGLGGEYDEVFLGLHGAHQAQNAALALAATEAFLGAGTSRTLDQDLVRAGFADARSPGRLERVRTAPTILLDAAHNPAGMAATVTALGEEFDFRRLVAVVAAAADKDVAGMLELLEPAVAEVVTTRNSSPRSLPPHRLAALAAPIFGEERVRIAADLPDAIEAAVALAEEDMGGELGGVGVLVTGSINTVTDARALLARGG